MVTDDDDSVSVRGPSFRYIESMVHFASIRHPAAILDDLHGKVLNEAYQISKSTVTESVSPNRLSFSSPVNKAVDLCPWHTQSQAGKQEQKLSKPEGTTHGSLNTSHGQTDPSVKPDNVKIKGLQANVSIPKVRPPNSSETLRSDEHTGLLAVMPSVLKGSSAEELNNL